MAGTPEHNLDARARTMDQPLASQVQAVGRDINTVLARFHAVSRHAPSVVAQDGTLEAVPCSVIESWEVQFQKRLDECELDKQAVVQRCSREKKEVVDAAKQHIAEINATATRLEQGYASKVITTRVLQRALRDADDDLRSQAQQVRMQMEENNALGVELLHARELLGAERASAEQSKWRLEATQAAAQATTLAARGGAAAGRYGARRLGEAAGRAAPHRAVAAQDCGRSRYMH